MPRVDDHRNWTIGVVGSRRLIALVASDRTGGTEDTVRKAKKLRKKVILV
jgi:hypothetical protein